MGCTGPDGRCWQGIATEAAWPLLLNRGSSGFWPLACIAAFYLQVYLEGFGTFLPIWGAAPPRWFGFPNILMYC